MTLPYRKFAGVVKEVERQKFVKEVLGFRDYVNHVEGKATENKTVPPTNEWFSEFCDRHLRGGFWKKILGGQM